MLGKKEFEPKLIYNLDIGDLIPEDNFYRQLNKLLDLRFVYQECENLYGKTGNPSIDPVVFFKLNLFGFFENIISDRELVRRAGDSLSIRYYLGYDIDEKLPWHSTISRTRGLIKKETFEKIFEKVLEKCNEAGLIEGKHQSIDSTLVKANASYESVERKEPKLSIKEFTEKTYEENKEDIKEKKDKDNNDDEDKPNSEIKQAKINKKKKHYIKDRNKKYFSRTDPDSRIAKKPGKMIGLYYTTHYAADSKNRVITDVLTTNADRKDSGALMEVYERSEERLKHLGLTIEELSADKGYCSGENLRELESRQVKAYIPFQKTRMAGSIPGKKFIYNEDKDIFVCPSNKELKFSTYDKKRQTKRYWAKRKDCSQCPLKEKCCPNTQAKNLNRTIFYKEYERTEERLKTPMARRAAIIRETVSEGLFAEAKGNHGLRKFMTRGIDNAQKKSYLIATVQNLKRLIKSLKTKSKPAVQHSVVKHQEKLSNNIFGKSLFDLNFAWIQ